MKGPHPLKRHNIRKKSFKSASKKVKDIFTTCAEKALTSDVRAKHCACLVRNGKIHFIECNQSGGCCNGFSTHSEASIHKKMGKQNKRKARYTYDLYIIRYSEASGYMNSKPCTECTRLIKNEMDYVNKVIYSYDKESYIVENKETLKTKHISHGYHNFRNKANC